MTRLVLRRVRSGGVAKLKCIPVMPRSIVGGGVVKLDRVQIVCPACGQQVQAVATDGRVKGYCAVARQSVDFLIETQQIPKGRHFTAEARDKISASAKKRWQDPEYRAKQSTAVKKRGQDPEYRAKLSAAAKKLYQDPEYRAKMKASHSKEP